MTMRRRSMILCVLLAGCSHPAARTMTVTLRSGAHTLRITAEVARTPEQRRVGLMGRSRVPVGTGMLFLYPRAAAWGGYWMKDTLVPLDIAFIRAGRVVEIDTMTPCRADPCPLTTPAEPFDAVLEAPAGTFAAIVSEARVGWSAS